MILRAHGFSVAVPKGWDARIFRRAESDVPSPGPDAIPTSGFTTPVVHLGSFPLPEGRGDYGSGAVNLMRSRDVFVALVEFGPESVGSPLFAPAGMPRMRAAELSESVMQRPVAGLAGAQRFFTVGGRPFCGYAVVGSAARRSALVAEVNRAFAAISVDPR